MALADYEWRGIFRVVGSHVAGFLLVYAVASVLVLGFSVLFGDFPLSDLPLPLVGMFLGTLCLMLYDATDFRNPLRQPKGWELEPARLFWNAARKFGFIVSLVLLLFYFLLILTFPW